MLHWNWGMPTTDNGGSPEGDRGEQSDSDAEEEQFDITLSATHAYLSPEGLATVSGRSVLEAGWTGRVACVAHLGLVFPGETVPMLLTHPPDAAALAQAIDTHRLFCLLCPDESGAMLSGYGVLCEVFEAGEAPAGLRLPDESPPPLTCKARALHRVRLLDLPPQPQPVHIYIRIRELRVRVLPEIRLGDPLWHSRLASLDPLRKQSPALDRRLRSADASVTPWPRFVYDIFDCARTSTAIRKYFRTLGFESLPEDTVSLSFWAAANIPLPQRERLALFLVDNALLRLHMAVAHISKQRTLCCVVCGAEIALLEHALQMSSAGIHGSYTNLGGFMHDIMTLSQARNVTQTGQASEEFSWFPGYSWSIISCRGCMAHVGWRYDAVKKTLRPRRFYGLCRNNVMPRSPDAADADAAAGP